MESPEQAHTPSAVTPALQSLTLVGKTGGDATDSARRSTRVRRAPAQYSPPPPSINKRKRNQKEVVADDGSSEQDDEGSDDSDDDGESEDGEDNLETPSRSKSARKRSASGIQKLKSPVKPPQKRSRTAAGAVVTSPQPTSARKRSGASNPSKRSSRAANGDGGTGGGQPLFDSVLAEEDFDELANGWTAAYEANKTAAMTTMVNFILKCCGCENEVTMIDIDDADSAQDKLQDIQDVHQNDQQPDYPIVSRRSQFRRFKKSLVAFTTSLITHIHAKNLLYKDPALLENMQVWITAMSSSPLRSFRHTSTIISLAMITELCSVVAEITSEIANTTKQVESEKKKARSNAGRIKSLDQKINESQERRDVAQMFITEIYESVFVHRYRDVDHRIRAECIHELGLWIVKLPDVFFEASYLRYLGWVLSDTSAQTRVEVLRALSVLFKDRGNVGGLRPFTERFRPRLVEMALQDADSGVRSAAIVLLNEIRQVGFLEVDEVDSIGKVLYDNDGKVRDAVAHFVADNVNESYDDQIEEFGGIEEVEAALKSAGDLDDDEFEGHQLSWIKLRCVVDSLSKYDQDDVEDSPSQRGNPLWEALSGGTGVGDQTRISLAGTSLWKVLPEIQDWTQIAKYLLYDHSAPQTSRSKGQGVLGDIRKFCALTPKEDGVLLQILHAALFSTINIGEESLQSSKSRKKKRPDHEETMDHVSRSLAQIIPRLLNKFGPVPDAAATVLRIVQLMKLDIYQDLRQIAAYSSLLEDVIKQFSTHADEAVLKEASASLLHAKSFEELEDVTLQRLGKLQDDTVSGFIDATRGKELATAAFGEVAMQQLGTSIRRLEYLAGITDCKEALETSVDVLSTQFKGKSRNRKSNINSNGPDADSALLPVDLLLALLSRATTVDETETELLLRTQKTLNLYFMWKVQAVSSALGGESTEDEEQYVNDLRSLKQRQSDLLEVLERIIEQREKPDAVKMTVAGSLLEVYTLGAALSSMLESNDVPLPRSVPVDTQKNILSVYAASEKSFGKLANKSLDLESDNEESDEEEEENDEEEEGQLQLVQEQRLCTLAVKIVLAILSGVVEDGLFRPRLLRNKAKLGSSMKEVLHHLEEEVSATSSKKSKKVVPKKASEKVVEIQDEDQLDDDIEDVDEEAQHENEVVREEQMAQEEEAEHQRRQAESDNPGDEDEEMADADD